MTNPAFKAFNQSFSCRGGLVLPFNLDMKARTEIEIDFGEILDQSVIDFISTVYVNNKDGTVSVSLISNLTGQLVFAQPDSIGYFPLMLDKAGAKVMVRTSAVSPLPIRLIFSNIPYFPFYQKF
jgi:hypothetical protein